MLDEKSAKATPSPALAVRRIGRRRPVQVVRVLRRGKRPELLNDFGGLISPTTSTPELTPTATITANVTATSTPIPTLAVTGWSASIGLIAASALLALGFAMLAFERRRAVLAGE